MTVLVIGLVLALLPLLAVIAFTTGERFERDRWLEAIPRKAIGADDAVELKRELRRLCATVRKDGWTNAP